MAIEIVIIVDFPSYKMVIFYSYVSLPEGICDFVWVPDEQIQVVFDLFQNRYCHFKTQLHGMVFTGPTYFGADTGLLKPTCLAWILGPMEQCVL